MKLFRVMQATSVSDIEEHDRFTDERDALNDMSRLIASLEVQGKLAGKHLWVDCVEFSETGIALKVVKFRVFR